MIPRRAVLLSVAAIGLGACGGDDKSSEDGPPKLSLGTDTCDRCTMVIGEERHAAALKNSEGKWLLFDDCGEMIVTAQEQESEKITAWVHDYDKLTWQSGTEAFFVWMPDRSTPMATGVIAFAERAQADAKAAATSGWVKSWSEMLADWSMDMGGH